MKTIEEENSEYFNKVMVPQYRLVKAAIVLCPLLSIGSIWFMFHSASSLAIPFSFIIILFNILVFKFFGPIREYYNKTKLEEESNKIVSELKKLNGKRFEKLKPTMIEILKLFGKYSPEAAEALANNPKALIEIAIMEK